MERNQKGIVMQWKSRKTDDWRRWFVWYPVRIVVTRSGYPNKYIWVWWEWLDREPTVSLLKVSLFSRWQYSFPIVEKD